MKIALAFFGVQLFCCVAFVVIGYRIKSRSMRSERAPK